MFSQRGENYNSSKVFMGLTLIFFSKKVASRMIDLFVRTALKLNDAAI